MVRRFACVILAAFLVSCTDTPHERPPVPPAAVGGYLGVHDSVVLLASDEFEGRGIGTSGLEKAAAYLQQSFIQFGLRPGGTGDTPVDRYFQSFPYKQVSGTDPSSTLVGPGKPGEVNVSFRPLSFSADGTFDAPVVFAGFGASRPQQHYDDYADVDVKGKVALVLRYEPRDKAGRSIFTHVDEWSDSTELATKARVAQEKGAVALLITEPVPNQLMSFRRMADGVKIPVVSVTPELANEWLKRGAVRDVKALRDQIESDGRPASAELADVKLAGNIKLVRRTDWIRNVIGVLPGRGPTANEVVVIGAHYDHLGYGIGKKKAIHNGADDNASGTTAMLELARRYCKRQEAPKRTLVFIAFSGEESGVLGSSHFVNHPTVPLSSIVAMINFDMVGRLRNEQLMVGGRGTAAGFKEILQQADDGSPLVLKSSGEGGYGPSDHISFALKKIPVLFFWTGIHSDYHTPTDDSDKVSYAGLDQVIDFGEKVIDRIVAMPRQPYEASADKNADPHGGMFSGEPPRVTLGVVPDYNAEENVLGVRIAGSRADTPAAKAGLIEGDVIIKLGDYNIESIYSLTSALATAEPDKPTTVTILRNGEKLELPVTLTKRKQ